ncbi:MAG: CHAT domain-containing protein [Bacteroidetes bacterium]|nr:CHAT domain-containing protein [Bacteroidota bacterium]
MRFVFLLSLTLCSAGIFGQAIPKNPNKTDEHNLRQGKWTIWFDKEWELVTSPDSAVHYRVIEYKDDKPVGLVIDYYRSGQVQFTGRMIQDRPTEIFDGLITRYHENGKVEEKGMYNKGRKEGNFEYYNADGTINNQALADFYYDKGDYDKARPLYEQVKNETEKKVGKQHEDYAYACMDLAFLYRSIGLFTKTEANYLEALEVYKKPGADADDYARVVGSLGELYYKLGQYKKAEPLMLQARDLILKKSGKRSTQYVTSQVNLANFYGSLGQQEKAEAILIESKEIAFNMNRESTQYTGACHNLAVFYQTMKKYELAEPLFNEALTIRERMFGKRSRYYTATCLGLGQCYSYRHMDAKAEAYLKEAVDLSLSLFSEHHYYYGIACNALAVHYSQTGQYAQAEVYAKKAMEATEKSLGTNHSSYAVNCWNIGDVYKVQGRYTKAAPYFLKGRETHLSIIENQFAFLSASEREDFLNSFKVYFEHYNSFGLLSKDPKALGVMYDNQLIIKALLFNTQNKIKKNILNSGDTSLIRKFQDWQDRHEYLAKVYQMSIDERKKRNINLPQLEEQANTVEKQLAALSETFSKGNDKKRYTWRDVQKRLKPKEAAIEMVRFRWMKKKFSDTLYYAALIVTPESKHPELVLLENGRALEKCLVYYRNCIKLNLTDTLSYAMFWKPIANKLKTLSPSLRKVYFSPDGAYYSLNLQTLFNPRTEKYLADETDIQVVTNTKDIVLQKGTRDIPASASLFGYPDYNTIASSAPVKSQYDDEASAVEPDSISTLLPKGNIAMLPGTEKEVKELEKSLQQAHWQTSSYLLADASELKLKNLPKPKLLHIATHGFFMSEDNTDQKKQSNPLLRAGLLLAGAQQTLNGKTNPDGEDGILTAYEAMNLNLDDTELVVLSACETGLGEVKNGEGVFGLQRAFQTAGAKSIIMSLWKVSDESTEELMRAFYDRWLATGNKREAFKQAQLQIKDKYKDPYHWGAFVIVGE